jgi:thioredoxin-related protein
MVQFFAGTVHWENDFEKAKQQALSEKKYILLNFSGSDWCGPCIRMHKEIFESNAFEELASKKLILMNADFPRLKKNQLSKTQQEQNDQLADKYNAAGSFPLTVLLTPDGKLVKVWEGFPKDGADEFIDDLTHTVNAVN